jgi:hypothetical protein
MVLAEWGAQDIVSLARYRYATAMPPYAKRDPLPCWSA